jgi:glucosylceramidase
MKSGGHGFVGGSLSMQYYAAYAQYLVKYVLAMKAAGIPIYAVTPQNEPLNAGNDPSMTMSAAEEAMFIGQNLGPAFQAANLATKIVAYDHDCDMPSYPLAVLADPTASPFVERFRISPLCGRTQTYSRQWPTGPRASM